MTLTLLPENCRTRCNLILEDVDITIVNAIRRSLLSNIVTFAFDDINIEKNTSNLDDDMITHRISLIPVNSQIHVYCDITNNTTESLNIYSHDLKLENKEHWIYPDILISILKPGQILKFNATSIPGIAKNHNKWCHITDMHFSQDQTIYFNGNKVEKDTLIDISNVNIKNLQERLPSLFKNSHIDANKLLIDHNLFNVINELIGSEIINCVDEPRYNISFSTIDNTSGTDALKQAIHELYSECQNCKLEELPDGNIKIYHDYSLVYMMINQYRKINKYNISGVKLHPLDDYMIIKSNSPTIHQSLRLCLVYLEQILQDLYSLVQ